MEKYYKWILTSNRPKHIGAGFLIGATAGIVCALLVAAAVEIKDWCWKGHHGGFFGWIKGNGFDWLDFVATIIGGTLGAVVHELLKRLM